MTDPSHYPRDCYRQTVTPGMSQPLLVVNWINSKHRLVSGTWLALQHDGPYADWSVLLSFSQTLLGTVRGVAPVRLHSQCGLWIATAWFGRGREVQCGDRRQFGLLVL